MKDFNTSENREIYGDYPLYPVREISTVRDMFDSSCDEFSERIAILKRNSVKEEYIPVTYKKLRQDVYALGTALIKLGLKDKKIAVIGENRYEWAVSYLAVVCGAGTVVPIDKGLKEREIVNCIDFVNADALIYSSKVRKNMPELFETVAVKTICMDDGEGESIASLIDAGNLLIESGDRSFIDAVVLPEDVSILLFTSGTTGNPKAVMLSHKNIASNLMSMCSMIEILPEDRFFSLLPLHHTYECTCGFLCPLYRGSSIAYCMGLKYIVKNMLESSPTVVLTVPLVIENIYRQIVRNIEKNGLTKKVEFAKKLSAFLLKFKIDVRKKLFKQIHLALGGKIRLFISGGAAADPAVLRNLRSFGFCTVQGYGLTECSPIAALNRLYYFDDKSAGLPPPEVLVEIESPDEDGNGEIIVKGDNVMQGYYKNPEATFESLRDGWYHTGDIGCIKNGFVYITGRKKDMILTGSGENVFPEEVEYLLNKAPLIKESMVYGKVNEKTGKTSIAAHILPDTEQVEKLLGKEYNEDELSKLISGEIREINEKMASFKAVTDFDIRKEEFEKTTTQKIKRFAN